MIKVNSKKKQIDLSMKTAEEPVSMPQDEEDTEEIPTAMELALRRAMQGTDMAEEFESSRKQQKQNRREKRNDKHRQQQDALLARTLQNRVK